MAAGQQCSGGHTSCSTAQSRRKVHHARRAYRQLKSCYPRPRSVVRRPSPAQAPACCTPPHTVQPSRSRPDSSALSYALHSLSASRFTTQPPYALTASLPPMAICPCISNILCPAGLTASRVNPRMHQAAPAGAPPAQRLQPAASPLTPRAVSTGGTPPAALPCTHPGASAGGTTPRYRKRLQAPTTPQPTQLSMHPSAPTPRTVSRGYTTSCAEAAAAAPHAIFAAGYHSVLVDARSVGSRRRSSSYIVKLRTAVRQGARGGPVRAGGDQQLSSDATVHYWGLAGRQLRLVWCEGSRVSLDHPQSSQCPVLS